MAKWYLVVACNCTDETQEVQFNEWYNQTHIPDVLKTPGFIRATRFENVKPSERGAKYVATYEIETDDFDAFLKAHNDNIAKLRAQGRLNKLLVTVSNGFYKQISSVSR